MKFNPHAVAAPLTVALPDGATITLRPWASGAVAAARAAYAAALAETGKKADADVAFTAGAVAWAAIAWTGVEDLESGQPLPLEERWVTVMVTQLPEAMDALDRAYVLPGMALEREKNASGSAQDGAGQA
ncbi:hypothetical protein J2X45_003401 [Caulobacter sp. BE264]|uniref:hypothetical protein n=1 Tax=Caulobacter sp. BE264 TaxID=2817724 RepID=UPI002857AA2A|nr:hypothetical protein [Caulobacter sp. BE264]MDR7232295.1 hypothetical protein [Caulobacter sp. BE264]